MMNYFRRFGITVALVLFLIGVPLLAAENNKDAKGYIQDLKSSDPSLQVDACRKLGAMKEVSAVDPLVDLLKNSKNEDVERNAALALGMIGQAGPATDALLDSARNSRSSIVQYTSLVALKNLKDEKRKDDIKKVTEWVEQESSDIYLRDLATRLAGNK